MSDLGALLRKAREEQGLSLDDIQELTKIRKRYLEAIESGDHTILPGTFYVRAFVKNYSEAVGLDPDEVLRLYQHEVPAPPTEQIVDPIAVRKPRRVKSPASDRLGKIGFNLVMWCFLILIAVVVWYYAINKDSDSPNSLDQSHITDNVSPPVQPTDTGPVNTPVVDTTPPPPTQAPTTVTYVRKVGKADQYDIGPADAEHKIELKVVGGRNWVEVRVGGASGEKLFYANAEDGSVQNYDLTQPLYINVGRADYTELRVDGVLVPDEDISSSKKFLLNPLLSDESEKTPE